MGWVHVVVIMSAMIPTDNDVGPADATDGAKPATAVMPTAISSRAAWRGLAACHRV